MDVLLENLHPPPRNVTHFFRLFILQALRLSVVYKSIIVLLEQSTELIMSISIYLKCKYTYENAGFCILCIDDIKILKIFVKLSKFSTIFTEKRHRRQPSPLPPPPNVHMTFLVDKIDMWRFPKSGKRAKNVQFCNILILCNYLSTSTLFCHIQTKFFCDKFISEVVRASEFRIL